MKHFPHVSCRVIRSDHEDAFAHVVSQLPGCQWIHVAIGDHANTVENFQGHLKRRALSKIREIKAREIEIPKFLLASCLETMTHLHNHIPSPKLGGAAPGSLANNFNKMQFEEFINAQFGRVGYFKRYPIPKEELEAKGELGMVVGFEPATPSNLMVYLPRTNSIVSRGDFKEVKDLTEFKALMKERAKGGILDDSVFQSSSEFLRQAPVENPGDETEEANPFNHIVNSLQKAQSANPTFDITNLNSPMRIQQAIAIFGQQEVDKSVVEELNNLWKTYDAIQFIKEADLPEKRTMLRFTETSVGKEKNGVFEKVRTRFPLMGNLQREDSYGQTSSPTVDQSIINTTLSLAKFYRATLSTADVPAAYLNAPLEEIIYATFSKATTEIILKHHPELAKFVTSKGLLIVKVLKSVPG